MVNCIKIFAYSSLTLSWSETQEKIQSPEEKRHSTEFPSSSRNHPTGLSSINTSGKNFSKFQRTMQSQY